jgi:hypothetical protein
MNRKLQRSGKLYFVSLPTKWIRDNKLKKGDELDLLISNKNIIIQPVEESGKEVKRISVKLNTTNRRILRRVIISLFTVGFDEFEIKLNKKLKPASFKELKEIVARLGLNMIDVTDDKIKLNVNLSITDIKKFTRDLLYKTLNYTRMILNKREDLVKEQVPSFYNQRFTILRTLNRHEQSLTSLDIKPHDAYFYRILGINLGRLIIHLSYIKDVNFVEEVKKLFEKILILYDKPELDLLLDINRKSDKLNVKEPEKVDSNQDYRKRKSNRCIRDIVNTMLDHYFLNQT